MYAINPNQQTLRKNQIFILLLIIIIQSCQSDLLIDNNSIIQEINKLNFSKTVFEFSIDNEDNIIDTISIIKTKTDKNGKTLYEIKEYLLEVDRNIIQQNYYRDNEDLFYQETSASKEFKSIFETFVNKNNVIKKAQMISFNSKNSNDTIFMEYNYKYESKGKKETLFITSKFDSINSLDFTKFNKNEKPVFGYLILDNDTIQKRKMNYINGKLHKSTYEYKKPFKIIVSTFDSIENIKVETIFIKTNDTIKKAFESTHYNNKNTELIITKDVLNETIKKKKKITAHNNVYN